MTFRTAGVKRCLPFLFLFFCVSCARSLVRQSEVVNLVAAADYPRARSALDGDINAYGKINRLLYLLDRGYVLHLSGDYRDSIRAFARAKTEYDNLYTKSVSGEAVTWTVNDYTAPYRGEDFERVAVNIFQALNYAAIAEPAEALVEAREVDEVLSLINSRYKPGQKNVYKEDAFARFLSGILYETEGTREGVNDAFIEYSRAVETYKKDYAADYGLDVPQALKENILAAASVMGPQEVERYRMMFGDTPFATLEEKSARAEVYVIQYNGLSPLKVEERVPVYVPDMSLNWIAFPAYEPRPVLTQRSVALATGAGGQLFEADTEEVEDFAAIALQNLANRRARIFTKAVVSSGLKAAAEEALSRQVERQLGPDAEQVFWVLSGAYNFFSTRADARCWQTLPAEIRMARLLLEPGLYEIAVENFDAEGRMWGKVFVEKIAVAAGEKRFLIVATP